MHVTTALQHGIQRMWSLCTAYLQSICRDASFSTDKIDQVQCSWPCTRAHAVSNFREKRALPDGNHIKVGLQHPVRVAAMSWLDWTKLVVKRVTLVGKLGKAKPKIEAPC